MEAGTTYRYSVTATDEIFGIVIDSLYHSHFYLLDTSHWEKLDLTVNVPVRNLMEAESGEVYAYGDWGAFYRFAQDSWEEIRTPFTNHITALEMAADSTLWLGVRNEGIYRYDGEQFRQVPVPTDLHYDIQQILEIQPGRLICLADDGRLYHLDGQVFTLLDDTVQGSKTVNSYSRSNLPGIIQKYNNKLYWFTAEGWRSEPLPTKRPLVSAQILESGSKILTTRSGGIYLQDSEPALTFIEQAPEVYVEGNLLDNSYGAAFIDFNTDSYLDLFVFNTGENQFNRVFLNSPDRLFTEISGRTGLYDIPRSQEYAFEDFNYDGTLDVVFSLEYSESTVFRFFEGRGNATFKQFSDFQIPNLTMDRNMDLEWVRFDERGLPGLFNLFYYSQGKELGTSVYLKNKRWGNVTVADSTEFPRITGWNRDATFADLDNDDLIDVFISNYWRSNRILLSERGGQWREYDFRGMTDSSRTNSSGVIAVDYDLDGDLDIFEQSYEYGIRALENKIEDGVFTPQEIIDPDIGKQQANFRISAGDFDNDGFPDLVVSDKSVMRILLNKSGQKFETAAQQFNISGRRLNGTVIGDIDNDGDLDIYGVGLGANKLWVNQLNTENYLHLILKPSQPPLSGKGTKVWLYKAGHLGDQAFLRGYRQSGAENFVNNFYNSPVIHFGTGITPELDVKVRFPSGTVRILRGIEPGNRITVREHNPAINTIFLLPGQVVQVLRNPKFYWYTMILILAVLGTYAGTNFGMQRFHWSDQLALVLVIVNFTLFWSMVVLLRDHAWIVSFGVPLAVVYGGYLLPMGFSAQIRRHSQKISQEEAEDRLRALLQQFSHGEWAMSTLNSLHFLTRNVVRNQATNPKIFQQITVRGETFRKSILGNLQKILRYAERTGNDSVFTDAFGENISNLEKQLDRILSPETPFRVYRDLSEMTGLLKAQIKELKHQVFSKYSSDVVGGVRNVTEALKPRLMAEDVVLSRYKEEHTSLWALIPDYELADIIDNCVNNGIKALRNQEGKRIEIRIKYKAPKVLIEVTDNGIGIPEGWRDQIFEKGFSQFDGTGLGLAHARETLEEYGGRIQIKSTEPGEGTTILIELNEGVQP